MHHPSVDHLQQVKLSALWEPTLLAKTNPTNRLKMARVKYEWNEQPKSKAKELQKAHRSFAQHYLCYKKVLLLRSKNK